MSKAAKKSTATAPRRGAARPEEATEESWLAIVRNATHEVTHIGGGEDAAHRFSVTFEHMGTGERTTSHWELGTASEVARLRLFLAHFDFPLVDAGDLDAACRRVLDARCEIRVLDCDRFCLFAGIVRVAEPPASASDPPDGVDVWNHARHWRPRMERPEAFAPMFGTAE